MKIKINKRTNFYELWVLCIIRNNGKTPEDYSRIEGDGGYKTIMTVDESRLIEEIRHRVMNDITSTIPASYDGKNYFIGVNKNYYSIVSDDITYYLPITKEGAVLCNKEYYYDKYGKWTSSISNISGNVANLKIKAEDGLIANRLVIKKQEATPPPTRYIKRLFFDIETSPMEVYTWRIGNKISIPHENIINSWRIICIAYKWEHEDRINVLRWDEKTSDKTMLIEFTKIMGMADEIIGHNSDHFDIKKFRTRCLVNGIKAFPKYRTLDTLTKSREYFAFDSNKLDAIGRQLGKGGKVQHEGFDMWVKCLQDDKDALDKMCNYCAGDVILLEDIFHEIQHYIKPNTHVGVHFGEGRYSCPICGNNGLGEHRIDLLKSDVTEKGIISRVMECTECGHNYNINNKSYMDYNKALSNARLNVKG